MINDNYDQERAFFRNRIKELKDTLKFVRQSIHQAHHDGGIETCRKVTCDAIAKSLQEEC